MVLPCDECPPPKSGLKIQFTPWHRGSLASSSRNANLERSIFARIMHGSRPPEMVRLPRPCGVNFSLGRSKVHFNPHERMNFQFIPIRLATAAVMLALALSFTAPRTTATVLTFDIEGFGDFSNMSDGYGDNVTAATMGNFSYGTAGGFTPNISVSYSRDPADPAFWRKGYGDLENILFEDADNVGIMEVTFTADAGHEVQLLSWDMAAYSTAFSQDPVIDLVEVVGASGETLFSSANVAISETTRTTFDHSLAPFRGSTLTLRFESGNLGNLSDDIALDNIVFSQGEPDGNGDPPTPPDPPEGCDAPQRLTFDPGNERLPVWDPRGGLIAFTTDREPGDWQDLGGVNPDGSDERLLATGPQTPFGLASVSLGWAGSTGDLITNETVSLHEYLAFDVSQSPFDRTSPNGEDQAFSPKLRIDGGGGGGFLTVSRDGSTALWRFSRNGGGGRTTIHTAPYASLTGQSTSSHGTIHVDVDTGAEQRFLQGAALAPDGSFFILSQPAGEGHDLWLYTTNKSSEPVALTTTGETTGAFNRFPDISPDGTRVAFTFFSGVEGETNDIHVMNVSGGESTNLTNTISLSEAWPSWSPDGSSIAFGRSDSEGSPGLTEGELPNTNIYVLCLESSPGVDPGPGDGGVPADNDVLLDAGNTITYERITNLGSDDDLALGRMEISGDGSKIIYSTSNKNIYTMNADGSDHRVIFKYAGFRGGCPCLSPWVTISHDGSQVAWTDTEDEIFTANSDGTNRLEIASQVTVGESIRESRFGGSKIRFAKNGKLYYQIYMGRTGDTAAASGLFEINPDGTGLRKLFGFLDLWSVVPKEPDQSVHPGNFAVNDDGTRLLLEYDLQDPSSFFGPGAFHAGSFVTWDGANFKVINPEKPNMDIDLAISGDGNVIAYEYSGDTDLLVNNFAGTAERSLITITGFNNFDFRLNEKGTVIVADTGGTGGSFLATLLATDGSQRLDLMPINWNATPSLVRMDASGSRLVWHTGWKPPTGGPAQVWRLDVNPATLDPGFPQISNAAFSPGFLQQDGTSTTVMSATITNAPTDNWFVGMLDGEVRAPTGGGIGRFSFQFFDDGLDNDPTAGDGHYFTKDVPAFRSPELGTWSIRIGGQSEHRVTVVDVPGLQVIDGEPEAIKDTDGDGVTDLLEEAFGTDPAVSDPSGLPTPVTVMEDDEPFFGVELTVPDGGSITPENVVIAGDFRYTFELSDDLLTWRPAGVEVVISSGIANDGRIPLIVQLATSLRDATDDCYIRINVSRL